MARPLKESTRAKWNALIETEGRALGLSDCRIFLENKLVNDIFYEGLFKGRPCIVKCSSRAPESIVNEYELGSRLHATDPLRFPEMFACFPGPFAFVVREKIESERTLADDPDDRYADEVVAIIDDLFRADVVFRDILPSNFMVAADGRLKLIDFQFAVDMRTKRIDPWMRRHPDYHFTVFAAVVQGHVAWWDDADFATLLLPSLRQRLKSRIGRLRFEVRLAPSDLFRLRLLAMRLRIRKLFCRRDTRKRRAICRRLERFKWLSSS